MKNTIQIFVLFLSLTTIFSCESKRDIDGDLLIGLHDHDPNNGENPPAIKHLSKVTKTDADGEQSINTYNYTDGKLTSATISADGSTEDFTLTYDDEKITKLTVINSDGTATSTTDLTLTYLENGKLDSAIGTTKTEGSAEIWQNENIFSYAGSGKLSKIETTIKKDDPENPGEYIEVSSQTSEISFNSNNVSFWRFNSSAPLQMQTTFGDYDNFRNPFASLPSAFILASAHFNISGNGIIGLSGNNFRTTQVIINSKSQENTISYKYDADGYPTHATYSDGSTIEFEYQP